MTDGILLRATLSDPLLLRYSVVVVDDAHERSLNSDVLLGLLKKVRRRRPALRVVVTSATLQVSRSIHCCVGGLYTAFVLCAHC